MNEETKTQSLGVTSSLLDAFQLLKSPKDDVKLNGGVKIISRLLSEEGEKDVQYVLKRIVRSLGANIPDMRAGYFATLVTLLIKFEQIPISQLFELIKKELHANGSSKSEVGDVALGQILICSAIFRSGRMLKCTEEEQRQILQTLMTASTKKSYLRTVAYLLLIDFINCLDEDQFTSVVWSNIKDDFKKEMKEYNLDMLYFLLISSTKFPKKVKIKKLLSTPELLHEDNLQVIGEKLLSGIELSSVNHPLYKEIGMLVAKSSHLKQFWEGAIDCQLVKHNRNRELVCINLLTSILQNLEENVEVIPDLLSKNFFKLFMDWFKGLQTASKIRNKRDDEDDNKIMIKKQRQLINALAKALKLEKVDDKIRVKTLNKLLFNPGEINFSEVTGTTIIKSIIADLNADGVKKMAKSVKNVLTNQSKKSIKENVERSWCNNERVKAAELLSFLVSHESVKTDTEFKITYMKLLMCFGFFKIGGDESVAVSGELAGSIKTCFYRCFTSRFSNVDDLVAVLSSLSNFITTIFEKEEVRTKIKKQFTDENMECWDMVTEICRKIEQVSPKSKIDNVFLILLYQLGLFLFSEPTHVKVAKSAIKELKSCYEHYRKESKKNNKQNDSSEEPEWIEVLVEVLLSILSVESSVLRSVVQCVFRLLWEYLTPSSIGQIVSVIDPESEANPLTNDSESEEENNVDKSDNDSEDEDQSMKVNGDDHPEDSDDSESNMDDDDDEMKTPEHLRMAVQKALGAAAPESDTESVDADTINEEEGKKLDEALAEAFKQFNQGKSKKSKKDRKDKKALSDFRVKVLDLIDIYLEKDPAMDVCLAMIAPLTRSLEFCIQDNQFVDLENRIRKTIKNLSKIRKFSSTQDVDINVLCDYLKSVIDKGARSHFMFQALGDVITCFATFIIHCSLKVTAKAPIKKKQQSPLIEIFKEALQNYFKNRNCMLPIIFFHNILQSEWDDNYDLIPIIIDNIFDANVRHFRRSEGIDLMAGFYRTLNRRKPNTDPILKKLFNLEKKFEQRLLYATDEGNEFKVKNNFVTSLRKLINTMRAFHSNCNVNTNLNIQNLVDLLPKLKITEKSENNSQVSNNKPNQKSGKNKKNKRKLAQITNALTESKPKKAKKDKSQFK